MEGRLRRGRRRRGLVPRARARTCSSGAAASRTTTSRKTLLLTPRCRGRGSFVTGGGAHAIALSPSPAAVLSWYYLIRRVLNLFFVPCDKSMGPDYFLEQHLQQSNGKCKCLTDAHHEVSCSAVAERPEGLSKQSVFCRKCKKPGHNAASCSVKEGKPQRPKDVASKKACRKHRCSRCKGQGHNSATCAVELQN